MSDKHLRHQSTTLTGWGDSESDHMMHEIYYGDFSKINEYNNNVKEIKQHRGDY